MAWPSTGATWSWARSGSWPQSTEDSVRRSPRRARGPYEVAFLQLKTSSSGSTASSRTRSIRDLTKRGDGASGLRSTNGTPGLSSLGSGERSDRTMPASCQQRQPDPGTVSAERLWEAGAGSDSSGFLTPMAAALAQRSMTRDMPRGCGTTTNARTATHTSRFPRRPCAGDRYRVRIVPAGPRGGRATALPSCITEESERSPPGMPVGSERLSAGDIDGAAGLYGKPPAATAISTHPPGLEIAVDGERIVTPARFVRSPGSQHALPALSPQAMGAERFVCGRWNGEGGSRRSVTAGPASTWFAAHCIVQRRTPGCAGPPAVEAHPAAGSSRDFLHWGPAPDLPSRADRRGARSSPGPHRIPLRAAHARGLAGPPTGPGSVTPPQSTARSPACGPTRT